MTPISPQNLLRHELIGLNLEITMSNNRQLTGFEGRITDETERTLTLATSRGSKTIPKDVAIFNIHLPDGVTLEVNGRRLLGRPEERLKMKVKRW